MARWQREIALSRLLGAAKDLIHISPRRVWALSRLSIQEAIRRRVWVALVAFGVVLMFAGWFLDPNSPEPGPLYLAIRHGRDDVPGIAYGAVDQHL